MLFWDKKKCRSQQKRSASVISFSQFELLIFELMKIYELKEIYKNSKLYHQFLLRIMFLIEQKYIKMLSPNCHFHLVSIKQVADKHEKKIENMKIFITWPHWIECNVIWFDFQMVKKKICLVLPELWIKSCRKIDTHDTVHMSHEPSHLGTSLTTEKLTKRDVVKKLVYKKQDIFALCELTHFHFHFHCKDKLYDPFEFTAI